jgi:NCAIR mutase (PurE)-related protein
MVTRTNEEAFEAVSGVVPDAVFHASAGLITCIQTPAERLATTVAVVTAGTSDLPVADEAALTAEFLGSPVERVSDVGVAGVHRLLARVDHIRTAKVVVVVAGMEGALPSVVGGLVDKPVIAVPTSVGYGASFSGIAALLGMLNSCASGVSVVNIDNGFGAGFLAHMINRL